MNESSKWDGLAAVESFRAAVTTLRANPLRTILSALGVIIGVASIVAVLALADGLESYTRQQISQTTDLQGITAVPRTTEVQDGIRIRREQVPHLAPAHLDDLSTHLGALADATLVLSASALARVPNDTVQRAVLLGAVLPSALDVGPEALEHGRYIQERDVAEAERVAVVPASATNWYGVPAKELPGRRLVLHDVGYRIVGVVADESATPRIRIPLSLRVRNELEGPDRRVFFAARARRIEDVSLVREELERFLSARYPGAGGAAGFTITTNRSRVTQAEQGLLILRLVMGAIAGISLVVGGVGIMNILLASVFERTREIGIRRAMGARRRDIRRQLLAESLLISGIGSSLGVLGGLLGAFSITAVIRGVAEAQVHAAFTWTSVLVATGAALMVGLIFGTYPARRAERLSPIEAVRSE